MFLILFVFFIVSFVSWYQLKYRHRNFLFSKLPSPPKYFLIHNTPNFYGKGRKELFREFERLRKTLGPTFLMTVEPFDNGSLMVADPKMAEVILSSQKIIEKSEDYDLMKAWLGTGLLIASGKKWHQRRKIITPSFHFQILEKFVEIMDEQGKIFINKLEKLDGQKVNIFPLVNLYALDVICGLFLNL